MVIFSLITGKIFLVKSWLERVLMGFREIGIGGTVRENILMAEALTRYFFSAAPD